MLYKNICVTKERTSDTLASLPAGNEIEIGHPIELTVDFPGILRYNKSISSLLSCIISRMY